MKVVDDFKRSFQSTKKIFGEGKLLGTDSTHISLPGLHEEESCSSADVKEGQSFSKAPPQSHRLSTKYTTWLCS